MDSNKILDIISQETLFNLLVSNEGVIFISENIDDDVTFLYNDFSSVGISNSKSINDLLKIIDYKSEIPEIIGLTKYLSDVQSQINSKNKISQVYLPLKLDLDTRVYSLKIIREDTRMICYLYLADSDMVDIERLYSDSYKDSLTYLFNKNALKLHLENSNEERFVGFLDLDNFKYINDNFSHYAGNELLTTIGKKLISISDEHIIFYRYGGDEFVFLTVNLDFEGTKEFVNKIQTAINSIDFYGIHPSFSIGVAEYTFDSKYNIVDTIKIADYVMYKSKYGGKNSASFIRTDEANQLFKLGNIDHELENYKRKRRITIKN